MVSFKLSFSYPIEVLSILLKYNRKIVHAKEVAQEGVAPQEHASYRKKWRTDPIEDFYSSFSYFVSFLNSLPRRILRTKVQT